MIRLNYNDLNRPHLISALTKIKNHSGFSIKTAYEMMCLIQKIEAELATAQEAYRKLLKQYAEDVSKPRIPPEKQAEFQAAWQELLSTSLTWDCEPISRTCLENVGLSINELLALGPFLKS